MEIPKTLIVDECPLLKKDPRLPAILVRYNEAVGYLNDLRTIHTGYLTREDSNARGLLLEVEELSKRLRCERYLVGFLGTTGAGKSSILNSVLNASKADAPGKPGPGRATTSVVTRLFATSAADHILRLRYLDYGEYKDRRDTLAEWLGLRMVKGMTEDEIIAELDKGLPKLPLNSPQPKIEDEPYLRDLLESFKAHGDLVKAGSYHKPEPLYADREMYLNHQPGDPGVSTKKLLANAEIAFGTKEIPPELEMIDCPGFGATKSVDTFVTLGYIRKLDGALVVLKADGIDNDDLERIFANLKLRFSGGLESRVWVVVNKFDVPTHDIKFHLKESTFDLIAELGRKYTIPLTQVCLTCTEIKESDPAGARTLLKLPHMECTCTNPNDALPPGCATHPPLDKAFEQLLKDGGISNLRRLIKDVMPASVANEIILEAESESATLVRSLKIEVDQARKPVNQQQRRDARDWCDAVLKLIYALEARNLLVEDLGHKLKDKIEKQFLKVNSDPLILAKMKRDDMLARYEMDAPELTSELHDAMKRTVQEVYKHVGEQLKKGSMAAVKLLNNNTPVQEWEAYCAKDFDISWSANSMPNLHRYDLLTRILDEKFAGEFNGWAYQRLMLEKIGIASYHVIHAVRGQVRKRLRDLEQQLKRLFWKPDDPVQAALRPGA